MSKYQEALDTLINKTDIMNNTCAYLPKCLKSGKCHFDDSSMCEDYERVKLLQGLVDKEKPMKVIEEEYSKRKDYKWKCPRCYNFIYKHEAKIWTYEYCPKCAQKLDWSDENDK